MSPLKNTSREYSVKMTPYLPVEYTISNIRPGYDIRDILNGLSHDRYLTDGAEVYHYIDGDGPFPIANIDADLRTSAGDDEWSLVEDDDSKDDDMTRPATFVLPDWQDDDSPALTLYQPEESQTYIVKREQTQSDRLVSDIDPQCDDAIAAANYGHHLLFPRHRGVLDCGDKFVIFGNDGYDSDARARYEVDIILASLEGLDWKDVRFGKQTPGNVKDGSYSWAIVVYNYERRPVDLERWHDIVCRAWDMACDGKRNCDLPVDDQDQGDEQVIALRLF
jgi:hypothetical protein